MLMVMKKTKVSPAVVLVGVLFVGVVGVFAYQKSQSNSQANLSNTEIRAKFECDRVSMEKDIRGTDYYCANPDAYRNGESVPEDYTP